MLKRGFALVRDAQGEPVTSAEGAHSGDRWTVTFQGDQSVPVVVDGSHKPAPKKPAAPKAPDGRQGKLL